MATCRLTGDSLRLAGATVESAAAGFCSSGNGACLESRRDTAALVSQLDPVISVDTAVAHLAGGLGVPVWLLPPVGKDWRWQLNRDDTQWYPTMLLFRRHAHGAWQPVVARVGPALSEVASGERNERRER